MTRGAVEWLRDARDYANQALFDGGGLDPETLAIAKQPLHATLFDLVIGEALAQVPADIRALAPDIPWKMAKDLRNRIVHGYWQIDLETIAAVLDHDLDPLIRALDRLIDMIGREA